MPDCSHTNIYLCKHSMRFADCETSRVDVYVCILENKTKISSHIMNKKTSEILIIKDKNVYICPK